MNNTSIQDLSHYHIVEILLKLPVKTIVHCKCVCQDWLKLITDSRFVNLQLAKSVESVMLFDGYTMDPTVKPKSLRLVEIQDEHGRNRLHHDPIMSLDLNLAPVFQIAEVFAEGSVNGLICLSGNDYGRDKIYICNPITREYMILPKQIASTEGNIVNSYGFGVSLTGEYKVLRVFQDIGLSIRVPHAEIYTLGTGKWRSLSLDHVSYYIDGLNGTFLNNNVLWNIHHYDDRTEKICSFDIDNETFHLFPSPPVGLEENTYTNQILGVLNGCLCYSYYTRATCEITIWVMKEYGIGNSWQKEVVINQNISPIVNGSNDILCSPMGSLKDGSILMMYGEGKLVVYRPDTRTFEETEFSYVDAISYRPSFVKLQKFESESVHKFLR